MRTLYFSGGGDYARRVGITCEAGNNMDKNKILKTNGYPQPQLAVNSLSYQNLSPQIDQLLETAEDNVCDNCDRNNIAFPSKLLKLLFKNISFRSLK